MQKWMSRPQHVEDGSFGSAKEYKKYNRFLFFPYLWLEDEK